MDAARRVSLIDDPRLVRVLAVGESGSSAFIVSEHLVGQTFEEVLLAGPLPAETVRRVVGEIAEALALADARGLHHRQVTPASLVITPDGAVKLAGVAIEAALAGADQDDATARRSDATGLVHILYAGLTGRWPGNRDGQLGQAPRITGRAVAPRDLVAGVPADLDSLCSVTLANPDEGPASPQDLVDDLAPWAPSEPLTNPGGLTLAPGRPDEPEDAPPEPGVEGRAPALPGIPFASRPTASAVPTSPSDASGDDWALLGAPVQQVEPLGPFLPPAPITRPPRDQIRLVVMVLAGVVVVGLVLAVFSLRGLGSVTPLIAPNPAAVSTSAPSTAAPSTTVAAPAAPPQSATPPLASAIPVELTGVQAIDPMGDGDENGSTATNAIDTDPTSTWRSNRYNSADFGGLKQGLGLYVRTNGAPVTSVTVSLTGTGGTVELRSGTGPGLDSSVVVATSQITGNQVVLTPATPVSGDSLIVWFTALPQQPSGEYRIVVSEIAVS